MGNKGKKFENWYATAHPELDTIDEVRKATIRHAFENGYDAATTPLPRVKKWAYSLDGEEYYGEFTEEKQAYEAAVDRMLGMKLAPQTIYIAKIIDAVGILIDECAIRAAENILEMLEENCSDFIPAGGDDFIMEIAKTEGKKESEAYEKLGKKLVAIAIEHFKFNRFGVHSVMHWSNAIDDQPECHTKTRMPFQEND